jgi:hypothetical protein
MPISRFSVPAVDPDQGPIWTRSAASAIRIIRNIRANFNVIVDGADRGDGESMLTPFRNQQVEGSSPFAGSRPEVIE